MKADEQRALAQQTLRAFVNQHHRVPATKEWDAMHARPSRPTIGLLFGDWATFMRSCGYEPLRPGKPTADIDLDDLVAQLRRGKTLRSVAAQVDRTPQSLRVRIDRYLRLTGEPPLDLTRGRHPRRRRAGQLRP